MERIIDGVTWFENRDYFYMIVTDIVKERIMNASYLEYLWDPNYFFKRISAHWINGISDKFLIKYQAVHDEKEKEIAETKATYKISALGLVRLPKDD